MIDWSIVSSAANICIILWIWFLWGFLDRWLQLAAYLLLCTFSLELQYLVWPPGSCPWLCLRRPGSIWAAFPFPPSGPTWAEMRHRLQSIASKTSFLRVFGHHSESCRFGVVGLKKSSIGVHNIRTTSSVRVWRDMLLPLPGKTWNPRPPCPPHRTSNGAPHFESLWREWGLLMEIWWRKPPMTCFPSLQRFWIVCFFSTIRWHWRCTFCLCLNPWNESRFGLPIPSTLVSPMPMWSPFCGRPSWVAGWAPGLPLAGSQGAHVWDFLGFSLSLSWFSTGVVLPASWPADWQTQAQQSYGWWCSLVAMRKDWHDLRF